MCTLEAETVSEDNVIPETPFETSAMSARGGCPIMKQGASLSTSSIMGLETETETEYLMEGPQLKYTVPVDHGTSKECICPVCENVVVSGLALIWHLYENHPDARPYFCDKCEKSYHMVANLCSHNLIIHKPPAVHCKFCDYTSTTHARMRKYVRNHTKGEKCNVCDKSYPTVRALLLHKHLHICRVDHACSSCDSIFKSKVSLAMHMKSKHGEGYLCVCGTRFDSPVQCKRHQKKCLVTL